ncbi:hypothetical protein OROGR_005221 [Orobanche gracilis]
MGRRRNIRNTIAVSSSSSNPQQNNNPPQQSSDPPIAPPKWELRRSIIINAVLSLAGFFVTVRMIPVVSRYVLKAGISGYDINKKGTPHGNVKVPESLGLAVAPAFVVVVILFQYFNFPADSNRHAGYTTALVCVFFMTMLGFVDDVLDIPWRVKLVLPSIAALPLLMEYAGHTTIVIPKPLVPHIGIEILDLGWIYKLYMWLLTVFCTNSINIHAGLNGLEVGQTVVIAYAILIHNIMQIGASIDPEYKLTHVFSIHLVQPLLATSLALFSYNWYPSSVFVGDTYTYFAGMTIAVVGILGHFSETLLIFFLPQLSGYIPCPRHRLPRFDPQTGLLTGTKDGTLVNFFLRTLGPKSEKSLCIYLLVFQGIACGFCFLLRYFLGGWYK